MIYILPRNQTSYNQKGHSFQNILNSILFSFQFNTYAYVSPYVSPLHIFQKRKQLESLIFQGFLAVCKQGMRESNPRQKFWRLLSYHLTNPLYSVLTFSSHHIFIPRKPSFCQSLFSFLYFLIHIFTKTEFLIWRNLVSNLFYAFLLSLSLRF